MEDAANVHVELVKLVDGLGRAHVPQHAVVQHQVVRGVECGAVALVVVGQVGVVQGQRLLARLDVVDLDRRGRRRVEMLFKKSYRSFISSVLSSMCKRREESGNGFIWGKMLNPLSQPTVC